MSVQETRVVPLSDWDGRWHEGRIGFHKLEVHNLLKNNLDNVICGRKGVRFFFPLCGKAVDMRWLADMGHTVVGVEFSENGIKQFFEEQHLTYTEEPVPAVAGGKVFKSSDGSISIYQCDLFAFSSAVAGKFGGIWDRGAMVAINPGDREKYGALLASLMDSDCKYLLDTLEYNPELYEGPPFVVLEKDIKNAFGKACDIELLQAVDCLDDKLKAWGLDWSTEKVYRLTLKK